MLERSRIIYGDCMLKMNTIKEKSIDLICADLPYGKTKNKWDKIIQPNDFVEIEIRKKIKQMSFNEFFLYNYQKNIPYEETLNFWNNNRKRGLWYHYWRILKDNGAIVLFGQDKFTSMMMHSDPNHRYNLIWEKSTVTGHFNAAKMPMRCHEDMMVFYKQLPTYNPQKTTGHPRKVSKAEHKRNSKKSTNYGDHKFTTYDSTERMPRSIWKFSTDKQKSALTPTQKPLALIEEIIKTYSNPDDLILDNTAGSMTLAEACINTNREFIVMENNLEDFKKGENRIRKKINNNKIFDKILELC
jgi:DNA modification methylase